MSGCSARDAAAPGRAVFAVDSQRRQRRRRSLALLARRRTSSGSETARRTGSARCTARRSARSGPSVRQVGLVLAQSAPRVRLTAIGPATRRRRRRDRRPEPDASTCRRDRAHARARRRDTRPHARPPWSIFSAAVRGDHGGDQPTARETRDLHVAPMCGELKSSRADPWYISRPGHRATRTAWTTQR